LTTVTIKVDDERLADDLAKKINASVDIPYVPEQAEAAAFNLGVSEAVKAMKAALPVLVEQANGVAGPYLSVTVEG
jgi:hypothetical protein